MKSRLFRLLIVNAAALALSACGENGEAQPFATSATSPGAGQAGQPAAAPARPASGQALPDGALRVRRVEIVDGQGFERAVVAATMLIPADWQTQGGVVWNPQSQCGNAYNFNWRAASPDGSMGLALIPTVGWAANSMGVQSGGCPNLQLNNVQAYLQWLPQQLQPNARVLDIRPREDLLEGAEAFSQNERTAMGEYRVWYEAGEVLFAYTANGREMRQTVVTSIMFSHSRMADGLGGVSEYMTGTALPGYTFFAPNGQLDFKMAESIRKTFREAPEWTRRITEHNQIIARTNMEGARQRSQIIADTNREISQMQTDSWRRQQSSDDRIQRETIESIRGVETYSDANAPGGTVELSNMYNHAWRMPDDTYVLTDDAFFEPADGFRLEPAQ